ncbi:helix-turn-helix domain-containing protein [Pannonibacter indicus]|uniref:helix-turn-helix domain-containing protein n=1 Tax=Pannonibacter indicus TaxID=466044 RepID=UPI00391BE26D
MKRLDRIALGRALHLARTLKGYTTREMQALTGISAATVSRIERAHPDTLASAETALVLCDFFGLDPLSFLVRTGGTDLFHGNTPVKQAGVQQQAGGW